MRDFRVLVADDEPEARTGLQRSLSRKGYRVDIAANGLEAAERLRATHFDAVVADWKMPVIDGIKLLHFAKRRDERVVFVLVSGYATPDTVVEAMKAGSDDVIAKPFAPQEIEQALQRGLGGEPTPVERPCRVYRWPAAHMWVWPRDDGSAVIGADAEFYAMTGDLVYCDLPLLGEHVVKGQRCLTVTSANAHRLYRLEAPISGVVLETNSEMEINPWLAQREPYSRAWFMRVAPTSLLADLQNMEIEDVPTE